MTMSNQEDFAGLISLNMGGLLQRYGLYVVRVNDATALGVGRDYALLFGSDRDGLDVSYIDRDATHGIGTYTLRPLMMERFTVEDRSVYGQPSTMRDNLVSSIRVCATGLGSRCGDLLNGDKAWLKREDWRQRGPFSVIENLLRQDSC